MVLVQILAQNLGQMALGFRQVSEGIQWMIIWELILDIQCETDSE
jgi:hypothetical protein